MTTQITTHTADALNRLPEQFRDKPKLAALITALVDPIQELENIFWALLTERSITAGVGSQLDALGVIVGQPRQGLSDAVYRRYLRARIATNNSGGVDADIIHIAQLIVQDTTASVELDRQGPATVVTTVTSGAVDADTATALNYFLQSAKMAGVRLILEYSTVDPSLLFTLDIGPGLDTGILATSL